MLILFKSSFFSSKFLSEELISVKSISSDISYSILITGGDFLVSKIGLIFKFLNILFFSYFFQGSY